MSEKRTLTNYPFYLALDENMRDLNKIYSCMNSNKKRALNIRSAVIREETESTIALTTLALKTVLNVHHEKQGINQ